MLVETDSWASRLRSHPKGALITPLRRLLGDTGPRFRVQSRRSHLGTPAHCQQKSGSIGFNQWRLLHQFQRAPGLSVDKALSCGGRAISRFGDGKVVSPINVYLAGRATSEVGAECIPIEDIAIESSRAWLRANIQALDPERSYQRAHPAGIRR
jgi:hypothetical protein